MRLFHPSRKERYCGTHPETTLLILWLGAALCKFHVGQPSQKDDGCLGLEPRRSDMNTFPCHMRSFSAFVFWISSHKNAEHFTEWYLDHGENSLQVISLSMLLTYEKIVHFNSV